MPVSDAQGGTTTRRARKKARTRQEIYSAAMKLFMSHGFDAVTLDHICQAADVARGTFFLHFPSKDALLGEYARRVTEEVGDALHAHRGTATEALAVVLTLLVDRALAQAGLVQLVVREIMAHPQALAENTEQSRGLVELLTVVVRRGQASGEFRRNVEPALGAALVALSYLAIVGEWARHGGRLDLRAAVTQALDVVLKGITGGRRS